MLTNSSSGIPFPAGTLAGLVFCGGADFLAAAGLAVFWGGAVFLAAAGLAVFLGGVDFLVAAVFFETDFDVFFFGADLPFFG